MLYWHCVCDCGTKRAVFGADLKRRGSLSCGCLMRELASERAMATHRMSRHPAYRTWIRIKVRCTNPNDDGHHLYGGRGIKVCSRWETFEKFWEDMGPSWVRGASIDRIDTNGDYSPE